MSLKDIFEWIINVNLFYVAGAIVALVIFGKFAEWVDENEKKVSFIIGYIGIALAILFAFILFMSFLDAGY